VLKWGVLGAVVVSACLTLMLLAAVSAGAAPAWLAPVDLSASGQSGEVPQVAFDAQGNAVAVWRRYDSSNWVVQGAVRPAATGAWQTPVDLSVAGGDAFSPQVAVDAQGNAVAVWQRSNGTKTLVQAAVRPAATGVWQAPVDLSVAGQNADRPQVAFDSQGNAVAVWQRSNGASYVVQAAVRPAGGSWQAPVDLSAAGQNAGDPQVAFDSQGDGVAVWERYNGANDIVQGAVSAAGSGVWQAPVDLSVTGQDAFYPHVAVDAQGNAIAVWQRSDGANLIVQGAVRPAATGVWQAPADLSAAGQEAWLPQLAFDPQGNALAVWQRRDGTHYIVQAAVRGAGTGVWQAPVDLSAAGQDAEYPHVAFDAQGNAVAAWQRYDGHFETIVQAAGYDAAGPLLRALSVPAMGVAGQTLSLWVAPLDVWSGLGATSWSFGDGASASARHVTHAYAAPGSYDVTATSVDALANTTTATRTITITPAAAVTGLRLAPAKFRAARSGPSATTLTLRTATRVSYTLNIAASTRFTVQRATSGRTVSGRCLKPIRSNRTHKRCTRFVVVPGTFTRTRPAGADRFGFTGRLTGHPLEPGRYRLIATPTANRYIGKPTRASFRILK
jgi:hypothetical protein